MNNEHCDELIKLTWKQTPMIDKIDLMKQNISCEDNIRITDNSLTLKGETKIILSGFNLKGEKQNELLIFKEGMEEIISNYKYITLNGLWDINCYLNKGNVNIIFGVYYLNNNNVKLMELGVRY